MPDQTNKTVRKPQRASRLLIGCAIVLVALLFAAASFAAALTLIAVFTDWRGEPAWIPAMFIGVVSAVVSGAWLIQSTRNWPNDQVVVREERIEALVHGRERILFKHELAGLQYIPDPHPERQRLILLGAGGGSIRLRGDEFALDSLYDLARDLAARPVVDRICGAVERGGDVALIFEPREWRAHRWWVIVAGILFLTAGGAAAWWAGQDRDWAPLALLAGVGLVIAVSAAIRGRKFTPRGVSLTPEGIRTIGRRAATLIPWVAIEGVGNGPDFYLVKGRGKSSEIRLDYAALNAPFFLDVVERLRSAALQIDDPHADQFIDAASE